LSSKQSDLSLARPHRAVSSGLRVSADLAVNA
jgi:hypothetical protein